MDPVNKSELINKVKELNEQLKNAGTGDQRQRRNISDQIWRWNNILKRNKINGENWGITKEVVEGADTIKFVSPGGESITTDEFIRRTESVDTKVQKQKKQIEKLKESSKKKREKKQPKQSVHGTATVNSRNKELNALNTDYFTHDWKAAWSATTGKVYYYNTLTKATSWINPTLSIKQAREKAKREKDIREKAVKARTNRDLRKITGTRQHSNRPKQKFAKNQPPPPTNKTAPNTNYQPKNTKAVLRQRQQQREKKKKVINDNPQHWVIEFIKFILYPFTPNLEARNNILNSLNTPSNLPNNDYNNILIGLYKLGDRRSPLTFRIINLKKQFKNVNEIVEKKYKYLLEKINSSSQEENNKIIARNRIKNLYEYFVNKISAPTNIQGPKLFKKIVNVNKFAPRINDHKFKIYKTPLWVLSQKIGDSDYKFKLNSGFEIKLTQQEIPRGIKDDLKNWQVIKSTELTPLYKTGNIKVTTSPLKKNKFGDEDRADINHFYGSHISNTCFEYDEGPDGEQLKDLKGVHPSIKLQMRDGLIKGSYWMSQRGKNPVWKQNRTNHQNEIRFKSNTKLHGGSGWKFTKDKKNNKSQKAFIDLDKQIDLKNGWYMFELQNDAHDKKLTNETAMNAIKPALFFMKEEDLYFRGDESDKKKDINTGLTAIESWAKNRKILCEYEYRRFWVKKWKSDEVSQKYIKSIVDFNTTYYYCSSEKSKYKGLSDICGLDPLKALNDWKKNNQIKINDIFDKNNDISVFKEEIANIFKNMILRPGISIDVVNTLLRSPDTREDVKKRGLSVLEQVSVGNFLDNTINIPNLKSPGKELQELHDLNKRRISGAIVNLISKMESGLDELSEKSDNICTQSVDCIDKILQHIDTIYNFKNESTSKFNTIIKQYDEWIDHYAQLKQLGVELKDKILFRITGKAIEEMKYIKDKYKFRWKNQITNNKLKEVLNELIKNNFDKLLEGNQIQQEDIELFLNFTTSSDGEIRIKQIAAKKEIFLQRKNAIEEMFTGIQTKTNPDIKLDFNEYKNKLNEININIDDQLTAVTNRIQMVRSKERKAEEERVRREKEAEEKRRKEVEKAEKINSMKESIKNVKSSKNISLLEGLKSQIDADQDLTELKKVIDNEIKTLKETLEKEEEERIENSKKEIADNLNFILKNWKDDLLKKKYNQQKEKYRKDAFNLLQKALQDNIKIDNQIQKKLDKIIQKEQGLINKKEKVDSLLSKINNKQITLIKIYESITELGDQNANKYSKTLKDRIDKANDILEQYQKEGFVDKTDTIVNYIGQTEKELKTIDEWIKGIELNLNFLNSLTPDFDGAKISISDNFENIVELKEIKELKVTQMDDENKTPLNNLLVSVLNSVETKINNKIKELEDQKNKNTEVFENAIKDIKDKIKEFDETNKKFTDNYNELNSKKDIINQLINISKEKQKIEETLSQDIGREEIKETQNQLKELQVQYVKLNESLQRIPEEELKTHFDSDILNGIIEINLDDINTDNLIDGIKPEDEIANINLELVGIKNKSENIISYLQSEGEKEMPEDTFGNFKGILEIVGLQRELKKVVSEEASKENFFNQQTKEIEEKLAAEEKKKKEEEERKAAALLLAQKELKNRKLETKGKINEADTLVKIAALLVNLDNDPELGDEINELKNKEYKLDFIEKMNDYNSKQLDSLVMHMNKGFKNMAEPGKTRANVWG